MELLGSYGRWTVHRAWKRRRATYDVEVADCTCACGTRRVVVAQMLRNGRSRSCGCLMRELAGPRLGASRITHGLSRRGEKSAEYHVWIGIRKRCNNKGSAGYKNYGGRGVRVCERWASFRNFIDDMGKRPSPAHSIERIDNDGDYTPTNCKWATRKEQNSNQRTTLRLTHPGTGETCSASEWSRRLGGSATIVSDRLRRGWTSEAAITTPPDARFGKGATSP